MLSAVGTVDNLWVAGGAVLLSVIVLVTMVNRLSEFMAKYPDFKSLGLSFVLLIGGFLTAEGFGYHIPKHVIYSCLGFSLFVQVIDVLRPKGARQVHSADKTFGETSVGELEQELLASVTPRE